ncbi:hypothetical protein LTR47_011218 [Exophiala xenobiotica]|nr:hypothetical protein LTR92_011085 [Exophiala xenobiotica]KAK5215524.1 hypothetical protein LTR72_011422 [Exophiala xenobiotica]KAK5220352.1 hypothetical protein LTR47_011218 [Exophiala xenobiotica]KAK5245323.1 hypothetical protein LTS06_009237 [Exophiala xenobiotica]KAK5260699.1 hypothetical protein LTR40_003652 [Exophiala xenobiotica]
MARRDSVTAQKTTRQSLKLPHQGHLSASFFGTRLTSEGKRPQSIKKRHEQSPLRRSARLDPLIEIHDTQPKPSQQPLASPGRDVKHLHRAHTPPTPLPSKPPKRKRETEQQPSAPSQNDREHLVLDPLSRTSIRLHIGPRHTTGPEDTSTKVAK